MIQNFKMNNLFSINMEEFLLSRSIVKSLKRIFSSQWRALKSLTQAWESLKLSTEESQLVLETLLESYTSLK